MAEMPVLRGNNPDYLLNLIDGIFVAPLNVMMYVLCGKVLVFMTIRVWLSSLS